LAFETFDPRRRPLVVAALAFARARFGRTGLKLEESIDPKIRWRPTFHLKASAALIAAFEYNDVLYPDALDGAMVDITSFDHPVTLYQLCPLTSFQDDKHQTRTRQLTDKGIGIITIDEDTNVVTLQSAGVPLGQYIPEEAFTKAISGLSPRARVLFRSAYASFRANVGQGLQEAGQIVEAMIRQLHDHTTRVAGAAPVATVTAAANLTDNLYNNANYARYRGVLGGTRSFIGEYRNIASHPQRSAKDAIDKIRKCRAGLLQAVALATGLSAMARAITCRMVFPGL
jgi:hypothetical protein